MHAPCAKPRFFEFIFSEKGTGHREKTTKFNKGIKIFSDKESIFIFGQAESIERFFSLAKKTILSIFPKNSVSASTNKIQSPCDCFAS